MTSALEADDLNMSDELQRESIALAVGGTPESSVSKALSLLTMLAGSPKGVLGVSELASASGLPKSTTHRLLRELQAHDLVDREGTRYRVGHGLITLNAAARRASNSQLRDAARPVLSWLFTRTRLTVHLGVLEHGRVLYLDKLCSGDDTRVPSRVGETMPVSCTSLGKSLLAYSPPAMAGAILRGPLPRRTPYSVLNRAVLSHQIEQVRSSRLGFDREESGMGVFCTGSPVVVDGLAVAAVSVSSGSANAVDPRQVGRFVLGAADQIARSLAGTRPDDR